MLALIIGGSGSGKSAFAEQKALSCGDYRRVYIATMEIFDEESRKRVKRHRQMRAAKNFETIECPTHLENVTVNCDNVVLLECMSNLVANEMFSPSGRPKNVVDIICRGIETLNNSCRSLIVVTNDVFADGITYDENTDNYMRKLGEINCRIAAMADEVYEARAGIPTMIKG